MIESLEATSRLHSSIKSAVSLDYKYSGLFAHRRVELGALADHGRLFIFFVESRIFFHLECNRLRHLCEERRPATKRMLLLGA
jgi:hypothetical protein